MSVDDFDFDALIKSIEVPTEYPLTFFSQWEWWCMAGRPKRMFDANVLVLCPQDNQYHTPEEIEEKGWC